ncbi:hypothetical protein Y695_03242 [Hydrogenophaga sp. T4]|nr:hypothetical protein Y695_03242 [Hydrogenophaga sp. T4]
MHHRLRQIQLGLGGQGVHRGLLVAGLQAVLDFALQVFLDVGAQAFDRAFGDAERLGQGFVHVGQVGGFDLVDRDQKIGGLAGHVLAVVVLGKSQREGLGLTGLHAAHGVFKFLEHLAVADDELEAFGLAAFKGFAVDLAGEVDGDAVTVGCGLVLRALREGAALLAQDVQRAVDGGVVHFGRDFFDFSGGQVFDLDFGIHLENGVKSQLAFGRFFFFGDLGLTGDAQLGFVGGGGESLTDLVVHDFVVNRVAVLLGHHAHGHFAGTEAIHLDLASHVLEALGHLVLDHVGRQRERDLALELFQGFNSHGHGFLQKGVGQPATLANR